MRVITGEARGVPLVAPAGSATRPTSDRLKEAIFSALGEAAGRGRVLDLFAGSGALGIEALSRGAEWCDFVDSSPVACRAIAANLARTKLAERGRIHPVPVSRFLAAGSGRYDLVLLDPPYAFPELHALLDRLGAAPVIGSETTVLLEHASRHAPSPAIGPLPLVKSRGHGDSAYTIYASLT